MSTKAESLKATKPTKADGHQRVLGCLFMCAGLSRSGIAKATGMRLSSVCGRVNELIVAGKLSVAGIQRDSETERNVETVRLA